MKKQTDDLSADISRVILAIERCPRGFAWTEESVRMARSLVAVPKLDDAFIEAVHTIFREELGEVISYVANEYNNYDGNADAIEAFKLDDEVGYLLLICCFYPVATLNYRGRRQDFDQALHEKPDLSIETLERVKKHIENLSKKIEPLLVSYGYKYCPMEAEALQQSIRTGLFSRKQALDFLFYVGDNYN